MRDNLNYSNSKKEMYFKKLIKKLFPNDSVEIRKDIKELFSKRGIKFIGKKVTYKYDKIENGYGLAIYIKNKQRSDIYCELIIRPKEREKVVIENLLIKKLNNNVEITECHHLNYFLFTGDLDRYANAYRVNDIKYPDARILFLHRFTEGNIKENLFCYMNEIMKGENENLFFLPKYLNQNIVENKRKIVDSVKEGKKTFNCKIDWVFPLSGKGVFTCNFIETDEGDDFFLNDYSITMKNKGELVALW